MTRILVVSCENDDACSWYRAYSPFSYLPRSHFQVSYSSKPTRGDLLLADWLFVLRPSSDEQIALMQNAVDMGVKVWADYDDDLLGVTPDNPSHYYFSRQDIRDNIVVAQGIADVVSVTTNSLRDTVLKTNQSQKVYVVHNAFDPMWLKYRRDSNGYRQDTVVWRGSNTHDRDLMSVFEEIVLLSEKFSELTWVFVGQPPWFLWDKLKNKATLGFIKPITTYFKTIIAMRPKLFIAPLADTPFNRCKSNIASLEAASAGSVCVARSWQGWWNGQGYGGDFTFSEAFEIAINENPEAFCKFMEEDFSMAKANKMRAKMLEENS